MHLEMRDVGFFDVVHFDMHGVEDASTGSVFLKFVKHEEGAEYLKLRSDYRTAAEVGVLLRQREVGQVVLNACRSAHGASPETNIASAFVHAGVSAVIAMSYTISDRSVEIFTETLYQSMLQHGLSLEAAACVARRAMPQNPNRVSKFGSEVKVDDSIVPVVYLNASVERPFPKELPELEDPEYKHDLRRLFPYGREDDILRLESALLIGNKPVLLTGQAGIGTTTLLSHLRRWWMATGLVKDAIHIQLSSYLPFDATDLYIRLQRYFTGITSYVSPDRLLSQLSKNRCLIVLDSLESATMARKYGAFLKLLASLSKTNALVIIASRRPEKWLGTVTNPHRLACLRTIPGTQQIHAISAGAQHLLRIPDYKSEEDYQYLEQIVSLVSGNPLAIRLLVQDGLCLLKSPREYYFDMLASAPVTLNREEARQVEGLRSVVQLGNIINALMPTRIGDGFTAMVFASFLRILPTADMAKFVQLWSSRTQRLFGDSLQERAKGQLAFLEMIRSMNGAEMTEEMEMIVSFMRTMADASEEEVPKQKISLASMTVMWEDIDFPSVPIIDEVIQRHCTEILTKLKESGFLEERPFSSNLSSSDGGGGQGTEVRSKVRGYMAIHPLVPILLRAEPGYEENAFKIAETAREAFVLYYCYRTKEWPWSKIYYSPAWTGPRKELHEEFANFATAALMGLEKESEDHIQLTSLFQLLSVLQRGVLKEPGRLRIVAVLWEKALTRLLLEIDSLKAKVNMKPVSQLDSARSFFKNWTTGTEQEHSDEEMMAEVALFLMLGKAVNFSASLSQYYYRLHSPKQHEFLAIAKGLIKDMKTHIPYTFTPKQRERMIRAREFWVFCIRNMLDLPAGTENARAKEMFKQREEYQRYMMAEQGEESYPVTQKSWEDIPVEIVSLSAQFAHMITVHKKARDAIRRKDWKEAERLVDEALVREINDASNDPINKAGLLELRSEIAEGQGKWKNALEHLQESWRLQDGVSQADLSVKEERERGKAVERLRRKCPEVRM